MIKNNSQYPRRVAALLLYLLLLLQGCRSPLTMHAGEGEEEAMHTGDVFAPALPDEDAKLPATKHPRVGVSGSIATAPVLESPAPDPPHYDVFISHAGPDKQPIALPIYQELERRNIRSFVDEAELRVGRYAPEAMIRAMETARCGVFILSPEFAAREWPMKELSTFLRRYQEAKRQGNIPPLLVPVFHRLTWSGDCKLQPKAFFKKYRDVFTCEKSDFIERKQSGETSMEQIMKDLQVLYEVKYFTGIERKKGGDYQLIHDTVTSVFEGIPSLRATSAKGCLSTHYLHDNFARIPSLFQGGGSHHVDNLACTLQRIVKDARSGSQQTTSIDLSALFSDRSIHPGASLRAIQKILVIGPPGVGKTTLSKQLAYRWAAGTWGDAFKAVYVLSVRRLPRTSHPDASDLSSAIVDYCFSSSTLTTHEKSLYKDRVIEDLKLPTTLVILDGLDEWSGLGESLLSPFTAVRHKLLMLSRSYQIDKARELADMEVEHVGLSSIQLRDYVCNTSGLSSVESYEFLSLLSQRPTISAIARVPVNLQILCFLWHDTPSHREVREAVCQGSLPSLYQIVTRKIWQRYVDRSRALASYRAQREAMFEVLGKIALKAFASGEKGLVSSVLVDEFVENSSIADPDSVNIQDTGFLLFQYLEGSGQYQFAHLTFQEYFAGRRLADHLFSGNDRDRQSAQLFFKRHRYDPSYGRLFSFMAGLVGKEQKEPGIRALLALANEGAPASPSLLDEEDTATWSAHEAHVLLQLRIANEWLCISVSADAPLPALWKSLDNQFTISVSLQHQFAKGICSLEEYEDNDHFPRLTAALWDFRSIAQFVAVPCCRILLNVNRGNNHASSICDDTLLDVVRVAPSPCFGLLSTHAILVPGSYQSRKAAMHALVALAHTDSTHIERVRTLLQAPALKNDESYTHPIARSLLTSLSSPSVYARFDAASWKEHFGVSVSEIPPLPVGIDALLASPCPFWPGRKIGSTHLLVLIPSRVDGVAFTLNKLGELARRYFPDNKEGYRYYNSGVRAQLGSTPPKASYWLLMTHDILPSSRGRTYSAQQALVADRSREAGVSYVLPGALEAATAILTHYARSGKRLYGDDPGTYTHCTFEELFDGKCPLLGASGLLVSMSTATTSLIVVFTALLVAGSFRPLALGTLARVGVGTSVLGPWQLGVWVVGILA